MTRDEETKNARSKWLFTYTGDAHRAHKNRDHDLLKLYATTWPAHAWDAAIEWERKRSEVLLKALEFYAAPIDGPVNSSHIDQDFYDEGADGDLLWTGGKKAREALKLWRDGG